MDDGGGAPRPATGGGIVQDPLPAVRFRLLGDVAALAGARAGRRGPPAAPAATDAAAPVEVSWTLREPAPVKDPLEALGIPHTEVDLLLLAGAPVDLRRRLEGGETVEAHPPPAAGADRPDPDAVPVGFPDRRLLPRPLARRRLACDQHLGKLARLLRVLGFDVLWRDDWRENELAGAAVAEDRAVLTCNRNLLKRNEITCGRLVRSRRPDEQVREAVRRFGLPDPARRFARCSLCNATLRPATPAEVARGVPPRSRAWRDDFRACPGCGRIYWEGTHVARLRRRLEGILAGL